MTDWKNIDLDSWEISLSLIESLSFSEFILELDCNCQNLTHAALREQFEEDLRNRIEDAREVFNSNIGNILAHVRKLRKEKQTTK
jgi:hypothetical protein